MPVPQVTPEPNAATGRHDWVLHLVPPNGGGVDRFVRDLWSQRPQDRVLHVSDTQWVLETHGHRYVPLPAAAASEVAALGALGRPAWLHAHAVSPTVRQAAQSLQTALGCPLAVTLHDITFTQGDSAEQTAAIGFIQQARLLTAPSDYLLDVLSAQLEALGRQPVACQRLPNGRSPAGTSTEVAPPAVPHAPFDVAVVGALGPHKGLQNLLDVAQALLADCRVVLIGYADGQLTPGWLLPDRLWVHGSFESHELRGLLQAYGARLVLFPVGQPESFCYALSDVWDAGWPVLVPDQGALGERVRRHGQGQVYDPTLPPAAVADRLTQLLQTPAAPAWGEPEPSLSEIATQLDTLYRMNADPIPTAPPEHSALDRLAQTHLDGQFFRQELRRLQGDLDAVRQENERLRGELSQLSGEHQARGHWIEKLEGDIALLQQGLQQEQARFALLRKAAKRWEALTGQQ